MNQLIIVGAGPGSPGYMLPKAKEAIAAAGYVFADSRYLPLVEHPCREPLGKLATLPLRVAAKLEEGTVAVVVSGDPLFYSLTRLLCQCFPPEDIQIIPGIGSLNYLAAACRRTLEHAEVFSGHGRSINMDEVLDALKAKKDVYILCDDNHTPAWLARQLCRYGLFQMPMAAGSRLSYEDEKIIEDHASGLCALTMDSLCVAAAFGSSFIVPENGPVPEGFQKPDPAALLLNDGAFIRGRVPMTREEIRWIILGKLRLFPGAVVWDIGAGTGSVSVECARFLKASGGHVYSVECNEAALRLIYENKESFNLDNLTIVEGRAMERIGRIPIPDCVFIGGSGRELPGILQELTRIRSGIRVVTVGVTLETVNEALHGYTLHGYEALEITQIQVSCGRPLGSYHILEGTHPVTLFSANTPQPPQPGPDDVFL